MDQEQQFLICDDTKERPSPLHGKRSTCDGGPQRRS